MKVQLCRSIEVFDKKSEELLYEYPVNTVRLSFLQNLFGEPKTEFMLGDYKINEIQARQLEPFIKCKIDTEKYDCFLACYAKSLK